MKKRECPCCNEQIPTKYFIMQMLAGKRGFSFVKKEKGFVCKKCNNTILSAEKKDKLMLPSLYIGMIPFAIFGFSNDTAFTLGFFVNFLVALLISFTLLVLVTYRKYYVIDFACNDQSSDEYNEYSIHG